MKVIENFGKLKDGRDALMILNGKTKEYVICRGYDPTLPDGEQWYWGSYYFEFADFVEDVYKANKEGD